MTIDINNKNINKMGKANVSRDNFKSSLLKQVVIRIDYSEITNFEGLVQTMAAFLKEYFGNRGKYITNNVNVRIDEKALSGDSLPIAVLPSNDVYRFSSCVIEPVQNVVLDVANTFTCLIIDCNEAYDKVDCYLDLVSEVLSRIFDFDAYVNIVRVGIRKIDSKVFDNMETAKEIFENVGESQIAIPGMNTFQYRVSSFIVNNETGMQVNLSRTYTNTDDRQFQVDLDIDGYVGNLKFLQGINSSELLSQQLKTINDLLFDIFKLNVTEAFLEKGLMR